jgi:hypothetical protein
MDDMRKSALIQRLGLLQWANVELATSNATLLGELQKAHIIIKELRDKLSKAEEFLPTLKGGRSGRFAGQPLRCVEAIADSGKFFHPELHDEGGNGSNGYRGAKGRQDITDRHA